MTRNLKIDPIRELITALGIVHGLSRPRQEQLYDLLARRLAEVAALEGER